MGGDRNAALVERLTSLSLDERVAFVLWANDQPPPPGVGELGRTWSEAEVAAVEAFQEYTGRPVDLAWSLHFDPCFPETGWRAWDWARAMAVALASGDEAAISRLAPAFDRLDLPLGYNRPRR